MRHEVMIVKFTRQDFVSSENGIIEIDEHFSVEDHDQLHHTQVKSIPEVHITGTLQFDGTALVFSDLDLNGVMIVPDSITLEDIEVEFETTSQTTYSFRPVEPGEQDDIIAIEKNILDLEPEIFQAITLEEPISITNVAREDYPKGDGWQLISDQDPPEEQEMDPRWAKLNELLDKDD